MVGVVNLTAGDTMIQIGNLPLPIGAGMEQLRKKGTIVDDKAELASYREEYLAR